MPKKRALVWLRRDLRLEDHSLLAQAEADGLECALAFVFDEKILKALPKSDRRVSFIQASLKEIDAELRERGSCLVTKIGDPVREIPALAKKLGVEIVLAGEDYEPYAKQRDAAVAKELGEIPLRLMKDQVIFAPTEIQNGSQAPYKVFTAYKNEWLRRLRREHYDKRGTKLPALLPGSLLEPEANSYELDSLGFIKQPLWLEPGPKAAHSRLEAFSKKIQAYQTGRNIPSIEGTSGLSVHLRFGTISVRACVRMAIKKEGEGASTWLSELIWRDFFMMVLDQFPQVGKGKAFREEYDQIRWPGKEEHFQAWKEGCTGYPLVDAAMREFARTGWMHNRLRMVVASFLVKDLLIDWKKGEEYFAAQLLDFDLAANNGGWQWSASTGCDAQPYFRIFNPYSQSEKFDPEGAYIREQIPELASLSAKDIHEPPPLLRGKYPAPIVDHSAQRDKALALFKEAKA